MCDAIPELFNLRLNLQEGKINLYKPIQLVKAPFEVFYEINQKDNTDYKTITTPAENLTLSSVALQK